MRLLEIDLSGGIECRQFWGGLFASPVRVAFPMKSNDGPPCQWRQFLIALIEPRTERDSLAGNRSLLRQGTFRRFLKPRIACIQMWMPCALGIFLHRSDSRRKTVAASCWRQTGSPRPSCRCDWHTRTDSDKPLRQQVRTSFRRSLSCLEIPQWLLFACRSAGHRPPLGVVVRRGHSSNRAR